MPPVQYRLTRSAALRTSASAKSSRLTTVKNGSHLSRLGTKNGWVTAASGGKTGWFPLANTKRLSQQLREATRKTALRTSPGRGSVVLTVSTGRELVSTGRVSGKYTQLYAAGKTGWAPAAYFRGGMLAKYQTASPVRLYSSASSSTILAKIPADYTLGTRTHAKANARTRVEFKGKTGWVPSHKLATVALSTPVGLLSWKASAAKNIAKWCKGVHITAGSRVGNFASFGMGAHFEEISLNWYILDNKKGDPNHPLAVATQYHECAHILQYRAYEYDGSAMKRSMDKIYGTSNGMEHMADCMSEVMGAKRKGEQYDPATGATYGWEAGYGGVCTPKHLKSARKVIDRARINGAP